MRIAIVDERSEDRRRLLSGVRRWAEKNGVLLMPLPEMNESAEAFLRHFDRERFDVVFLDIYMAGMTGMDATRRIREKDNLWRAMCFIGFMGQSIAGYCRCTTSSFGTGR